MKLNLLTLSNPKTRKGEKHGYLTAILHLAPSKLSGNDVCPNSTVGCRTACLNTAGRGGLSNKQGRNLIQEARIRRTNLFFEDRAEFFRQLDLDIFRVFMKAGELGLTPAIRLNGTSDIVWEIITTPIGVTIFEMWPGIQFYDYTKIPGRVPPANYHLTFSFSGENGLDCHRENLRGVNVAIVFAPTVPKMWEETLVVDGDESDLRFLDPKGVIVGLKAKGKGKTDKSGFVMRTDKPDMTPLWWRDVSV